MSRILLLLAIWLVTDAGMATSDPGFQPFTSSLKGLEEFTYIKKEISDQSHKGPLSKITGAQAAKFIKASNSLINFEHTDRVQDFLDFYTSHETRRNVEIMIGISGHYLRLFETILKEEGLPAELKYLPMSLSSLNTRAVSAWGASGLWQIMFTSGKLYNLQIDSYVDERRDAEKATKAALQYLKDLYAIYGDWELAIAAYSSSPSNINKAIRKAGGSKKYTDLYPWLPVETRDYLPAFTACFILTNNVEKTGLKPYNITLPDFTKKETVTRRLHLGQVSEVLDIPLELLKEMNPEFKNGVIPAGGKEYLIRLPSEKAEFFSLYSDSIYAFKDSVYFQIRRTYVVSDVTPVQATSTSQNARSQEQTQTQAAISAPDTRNKTKLTYTVKDGDNLGFIAQWYNVGVSDIRQWNNLRGDIIRVGQVLDIWVPNARASHYSGIDGMTFDQKQKHSGAVTTSSQQSSSTGRATSTTGSTSSSSAFTWYTVKSGDNPTTIAAKYPGVSASDIMKLNNIKDPRNLRPGQRIKIPSKR